MDGLSVKEAIFVDEYCIHGNGTKAAIAAGYSEKTATQQASRLLTKVHISRAIEERRKVASEEAGVSARYVIEGLMEVHQRCVQRVPVMVFDPVEREMVQKTDADGNHVWEFDSTGANRALELLGKTINLFTDKVKIEDGSALMILRQKLNADA